MLPHPLLHPLRCFLGPSSAQELPHGLKDTDRRLGVPTAGHVWRLEMVAKTVWHHSSYIVYHALSEASAGDNQIEACNTILHSVKYLFQENDLVPT